MTQTICNLRELLTQTRGYVEIRMESLSGPNAALVRQIDQNLLDQIDRALADISPEPQSATVLDVIAERHRQISAEGWTPEHDDEHADGSLARAAACYASPDDISYTDNLGRELDRERKPRPLSEREQLFSWSYVRALCWPWDWKSWKPKERRLNLVRAGALILAEIERLDRAKARAAGAEGGAHRG